MAARFSAFLNSSLGLLLMGSLIGAAGLFTWQRQDWLFKERYHRSEVMVDRRLNLLEQINRETGHFVAAADDVIAAYLKGFSKQQISDVVGAYNKEEAQWFASCASLQAMLRFYFPEDKDVVGGFAEIVASSEELDARLEKSPAQAAEISQRIRGQLEAMNHLALQRLVSIEAK
jgi:hypothetical protein